MKLSAAELAYVRSQGLYVTEKCDGCGKLLNQAIRYTVTGKLEAYCSQQCRDLVFFGDSNEAQKRATPKECAFCGGDLSGKRADAFFCSDKCKKRHLRLAARKPTGPTVKSRDSDLIKSTGCGQENDRLRR